MPANGKLQILRGTAAQLDAYVGAVGEPAFDLTSKRLRMFDGVNAGGIELAKLSDVPTLPDLSPYARKDVDETFAGRVVVGSDLDVSLKVSIDGGLIVKAGTTQLKVGTGQVDVTGSLVASGSVQSASDARLKSQIEPLQHALDILCRLQGVRYVKDDRPEVGLIAQQVETVLPEVVGKSQSYYTVAYGNIVAVIIEAVKEIVSRLEALENAV